MKQFARREVLPSWWANALDGFLFGGVWNFKLRFVPGSETAVEVPAGAGELRAAISVDGWWRWNTAPTNRAHPGGAAGLYDVFVGTGPQLVDNLPEPNTDHTDYAFVLRYAPTGQEPAVEAGVAEYFRKVGEAVWDGAKITQLTQTVGDGDAPQVAEVPIGGVVEYAGVSEPPGGQFVFADGRLIDRTAHPDFFTRAGHSYNGGVDPGGNMVRVPDRQGRVAVGRGTHAEVTTLGANDGLPVASRKIKHRHGLGTAAVVSGGAHQHTIDVPGYAGGQHGGGDGSMTVWPSGAPNLGFDWLITKLAGAHGHGLTGAVGDTNGPLDASAHIVMNYLVRIK
ncbi:MAG TPA: hypothetical protein VF192_01205 [Longimicrobiales bacterium]